MNEQSSPPPETSAPSADAVCQRAYELWEREGRPEGNDLSHWLRAEQELRTRYSGLQAVSADPMRDSRQMADTRPQPIQVEKGAPRSNRRSSKSPLVPAASKASAPAGADLQASSRRRS